jgi:hypothetical protein
LFVSFGYAIFYIVTLSFLAHFGCFALSMIYLSPPSSVEKMLLIVFYNIHSRTAAMTAHPDKGGSEAKMAAVNEAYEVLLVDLKSRFDTERPERPHGRRRCWWERVLGWTLFKAN